MVRVNPSQLAAAMRARAEQLCLPRAWAGKLVVYLQAMHLSAIHAQALERDCTFK